MRSKGTSNQLVSDIAFPPGAKFAVVVFEDGGFDEVASYHRTRAAAVRTAAKVRKDLRTERQAYPFGDWDGPNFSVQTHTLGTIRRALGGV